MVKTAAAAAVAAIVAPSAVTMMSALPAEIALQAQVIVEKIAARMPAAGEAAAWVMTTTVAVVAVRA